MDEDHMIIFAKGKHFGLYRGGLEGKTISREEASPPSMGLRFFALL
jgi:hypothetical protein